jgi:hypothetical protein
MRTTLTTTILAAAALAAVPAFASAHPAQVTCGPDGGYLVDAPAYRGASATTTFTATQALVTWSDGYRMTLPLPTGCATPAPEPTPEPTTQPQPQQTPVVQPRPVTCGDLLDRYPLAGRVRRASWGCPVTSPKRPTTKPRPKPRPRPRVVTCRFVLSHYRGAARLRMIHRHRLPQSCGRPYMPPVAG